jgi:hypothetical protein
MPDDAPSPPSAPQTAAGGLPCARPVRARYLDARARGLAHGAATREAAALLWALWPSLPARQTEELAADIVAAVAAP